MQAACSSDADSCASVRPTSRRSTSPTTKAHTRPLGLRKATMRPARMAATTGTGTSARASRSAARCKSVQSASSSSKMRKCSLVMPEGPAAEPLLAVRRDARNGCKGSAHCSSGLNARSIGSEGRKELRVGSRGHGALEGCWRNPAREVARRGPVLRLTVPPGGRARWPSQRGLRLLRGKLAGSQPPGFAKLPQQQRGGKATLRDGKAHMGARARRLGCGPQRGRDAAACGRRGKRASSLAMWIQRRSRPQRAGARLGRRCAACCGLAPARFAASGPVCEAWLRDLRHQASVGLRGKPLRRRAPVVGMLWFVRARAGLPPAPGQRPPHEMERVSARGGPHGPDLHACLVRGRGVPPRRRALPRT